MRYIGYGLVFLVFFTIFLPRENIFFTMQDFLSKEKIYINSKEINDNIFLSLDKNKVFYKDINIADIDKINGLFFILYNSVKLENVKLNFQNLKINTLDIKHTLFNPYKIIITGTANFGKIDGYINFNTQNGKIYILNLNNNNLKYFLKKDKKGYFYEVSF
jgi:hypothetical protein